ncbi:metal-dependent hydrolase [Natrialbaceae archaeon A-CW2]|uniref:metal-dependent hydrolase n=1 Tax=Natronosalvus amylolyticus TaxID=2961994 RepID=UPI0020C9B485|nr:metal-dependent hydrolase [Natronosalvus amylolyticus]
MWPWEHVVVGYFSYSVFTHLVYRDAPGALETVAVVGASLLPDVIDKPLAWEFGVFDTGYALGHSVFFAIPVCTAIGMLTRLYGRPRLGLAFGVGYLAHLPADVIPMYFRTGTLPFERVLWPVQSAPPDSVSGGFRDQLIGALESYRAGLLSGELATVEWAGLALVAITGLLWLYDGAPVARELVTGSKNGLLAMAARVWN